MTHIVLYRGKRFGFAINDWNWKPYSYTNRKGDRFWAWLCFATARYSGNLAATWVSAVPRKEMH